MKILLLNRCKQLNGTQTIILRMARQLREAGDEPYFLQYGNAEKIALFSEIARHAKVLHVRDVLLKGLTGAGSALPAFDAIHCFTPDTLFFGLWIQRKLVPNAKVVAGVYHPRQYFFNCSRDIFERSISLEIARQLPPENFLFMNNAVKTNTEKYLNANFDKSGVLPIPVDLRTSSLRTNVDRNKIVSIGRLVDFKNYHPYMIDTLAELNREGYHFTYHIYGDGPTRQEVEDYIRKVNAESFVFMHGELPYTRFHEEVRSAFLFIGTGSALVEAASSSVPALNAIESTKAPVTYGSFADTTGYEVGEVVPGTPEVKIRDSILRLKGMTDEEYDAESARSRARALEFSTPTVIDNYKTFIGGASSTRFPMRSWMIFPWAASRLKTKFFPLSTEYAHA